MMESCLVASFSSVNQKVRSPARRGGWPLALPSSPGPRLQAEGVPLFGVLSVTASG